MDSLDIEMMPARHPEVTDEEKRNMYLIYHRKKYDNYRDKVLAKRKAKYIPTGRPVGRPRLPRE